MKTRVEQLNKNVNCRSGEILQRYGTDTIGPWASLFFSRQRTNSRPFRRLKAEGPGQGVCKVNKKGVPDNDLMGRVSDAYMECELFLHTVGEDIGLAF